MKVETLRETRETTVRINAAEEFAYVSTAMESIKRRLDQMLWKAELSVPNTAAEYHLDKKCVKIRGARSLYLLSKIRQGKDEIPKDVRFVGYKRFEIETVVNFNEWEKEAWVATRQKSIVNLMRRLGVKLYNRQGGYLCFLIPKRWVRFRKPITNAISPTESIVRGIQMERMNKEKIGPSEPEEV